MPEMINLVDTVGKRIDAIEKLEAHKKGLLHEAFSVFVFNKKGELLLQRRSLGKYHSGGLWTNTCCSHPNKGEELYSSVHRRLVEEMGFDTEVKKVYDFIYRVNLDHDLIEHEYDHVLLGIIGDDICINPNPEEVSEYKWINIKDLKKDVGDNPENYTEWMKLIINDKKFLNMLQ